MSARLATAALLFAALAPVVNAQAPAATTRVLVEQKASFVKRLLEDSPALARIGASGNAEAKRFVETALEHHRRALDQLNGGELEVADRSLNEAMWSVGKARQLVPDVAERTIAERVRYAQLLALVESLRSAYERHLIRTKGLPPGAVSQDADLDRVDALVEDAKSLANAEALSAANRALASAEHGLLTSVSRVLGTNTLRYAERFETLIEEFVYELDRNTSYTDLVPLAISEFRPSVQAQQQITRLMDRNRALREQAQGLAAKRDHRGALRILRSGTALLQRALATAGLVVPADMSAEGKP